MLVGEGGVPVLCDAQLYSSTVSEENGYHTIPSKCRWMPWERLIPDDDTCALGPPSEPGDIYSAAITIMQVRRSCSLTIIVSDAVGSIAMDFGSSVPVDAA